MAIIYSYPKVTSPLATDVLVLTDTTLTAGKRKNKTKSLALSDLAAYVVSSTSAITGSGTLNTIPLFTPTGVKIGDSIITQAASGQGVTVTGQLDVTQDFNATGSTELFGTLTVEGVTTFNADVESNNNVTVQGVFAADGNSVFSGSLTIDEQLIDGTGSSGTAGQVLSSTGTGVEWISDAEGVTGTGTANFVSKWLDSDTIQNSIIFDNGTNVGIGLTGPLVPLDVAGKIRSTDDNSSDFIEMFVDSLGSGDSYIKTSNFDLYLVPETGKLLIQGDTFGAGANGSVEVYDANNVAVKVKLDSSGDSYLNGGNVGIGTTSPNAASILHLVDTDAQLRIQQAGNTAFSRIFTGNNNALRFGVGTTGQTRMTILSNNGNVGIGTTTPLANLDVEETTTDVAGQIIVGGLIASSTDDIAFGKLCFANTAAANSQPNKILASIEGRKNGSSNRGILTFGVADGSGSNWEKMRIDSYGKVAIGTATPASQLTVDGGDIEVEDSASGLILRSPDGTRYRVTVANGGTLSVSAV
jgi:hypothetical protein